MEDYLTNKNKQISTISNSISVYIHSENVQEEIQEIMELSKRVEALQARYHELKPKIDYEINHRHPELMEQLGKKENEALELLLEVKKRNILTSTLSPTCGNRKLLAPSILNTPVGKSLLRCETPKMLLSAYKESPLIKKIRPMQIAFIDFEHELKQEMFDKIPKYMKGRETFEELKTFFDSVIIECFNEKYQLIHRVRNFVKNPVDLELWKVYKEQSSMFPGQHFITSVDLVKKIGTKTLDKKILCRLTMLRHVAVIQEQRKNNLICYIWTATTF